MNVARQPGRGTVVCASFLKSGAKGWKRESEGAMSMTESDSEIELTEVEVQVLSALASGASNKQIARLLAKSEFTVRNQLSVVFQKIGAGNRRQAAFWYRSYQEAQEELAIGTSIPLFGQPAEQRIGG